MMIRPLREIKSGTNTELRISTSPVLVIMLCLALTMLFLAEDLTNIAWRTQCEIVGIMILAWTLMAWRISSWSILVGKWLIIIMLISLVLWLKLLPLNIPGSLALLSIPICLAAAMISLPAAASTALGCTVVMLVLPRFLYQSFDSAEVMLAAIAISATFCIMYSLYQRMGDTFEWLWESSSRARRLLEEARDRKAELNQALDDLARANLELNRLNVMTQHLRQAAEDARASKEEFVANVSHELRTPLNMILSFSEMIVQAPETYSNKVPPALMADLTIIERNANHLSKLVDDVLDLSQIEAGEMALTKEFINFRELAEVAVTAVRPLYDLKGLKLEVDLPDDLPSIFCDRTRITEVFLNLLSNGGRFTEQGGVRVLVRQNGHNIEVSVADTGPGIAQADFGKLFRPFQQLDGSIRRRYGGTGLGLNISKRFIELHDGKIWVEIKKGIVTTFYFSLPIPPPTPTNDNILRGLIPDLD